MAASNRSIVIELIERGFGAADRSVFERLVSPDYVQHNPFIPTGRNGVLLLLQQLSELRDNAFHPRRILEDGDYVLLHSEWRSAGTCRAVFDLFRLEDGRLMEHWDAMQLVPNALSQDASSMWSGPVQVCDREHTQANKSLVQEFVMSVLIERHGERAGGFFEGNRLLQHTPDVATGVEAFLRYCGLGGDAGRTVQYRRLHRVVGEGNFVLAQSEGIAAGRPSALYDLYRLDGQSIVEHWSVVQAIEAPLAHCNGMF